VRSWNHGPQEPLSGLVADPDRVHHDDPPSRAGVVAVSVSLRHQRSSVTTHRPRLASSRRATGRTSLALPHHRDGVRQTKTGDLTRENGHGEGCRRHGEAVY
jgi:hypothetical protein